jgi:hypothetical protein
MENANMTLAIVDGDGDLGARIILALLKRGAKVREHLAKAG